MEEAFGINKIKEIPVRPEQQTLFSEWDWVSKDQNIPEEYMQKVSAMASAPQKKQKGK